MANRALAKLILHHYLRSALLPVIAVEFVLLGALFLVSERNRGDMANALRGEVDQILPLMARHEVARMQVRFGHIQNEAILLAKEHQALLDRPEAYPIQGPQPLLAQAANGNWYQINRQDGSGLYVGAEHRMGPAQLSLAVRAASMDPLYRHVVRDVSGAKASFFKTTDGMERSYPYVPKVWERSSSRQDSVDRELMRLVGGRCGPAREAAWTRVYRDPTSHELMVTCVSPVRIEDSLRGVVGLDVSIDSIADELMEQGMPWRTSAYMADDSGTILAMPLPEDGALKLKDLARHVRTVTSGRKSLSQPPLWTSTDPALAERLKGIDRSTRGVVAIRIGNQERFLVQEPLAQTGWRLFLVADSKDVYRSVEGVTRRSRLVACSVLGCMFLFYIGFYTVLRRNARVMSEKIAHPIGSLAQATTQLGTSDFGMVADLQLSGISEIDRLTSNFNVLVRELERRSRELVESAVRENLKEKEAELAFAKGQYESASAYLHNVGNLAVRLGSSAMDLQEIAASADQFPEVFRRLRSGDGEAVLDRFEKVLVETMVPRLRQCASEVADIRSSIHNTIAHQQRSFLEGGERLEAEEFDLSELAEKACGQFGRWSEGGRVELVRRISPGVRVHNHRHQIMDGLVNGLKNAFESIGPGPGRVVVSVEPGRDGGRAAVVIADDGKGVDRTDGPKLLSAGFTTKPWGHGLGLHSLAVFLSAHNGSVSLESPGKGLGATLRIEVGDA